MSGTGHRQRKYNTEIKKKETRDSEELQKIRENATRETRITIRNAIFIIDPKNL